MDPSYPIDLTAPARSAKRTRCFILGSGALLFLALFSAAPAVGQAAVSTARGKIVDTEGNPVPDVKVTFSPVSNPALTYPGKTNKKGRFMIEGMFTGKENDRWNVTLAVPEGVDLTPVEMHVETRTVNRVLLTDPYTRKLKPNAEIPALMIVPMGTAVVDFKLGQPQAKAPVVEAAAEATPKPAAPAPRVRDPWAVALTHAQDGNLEDSIEFFEKAIEAEPEDAERHGAFAKVLYQVARYGDAEREARRAIELESGTINSHMVLYSVFAAQEDYVQAKEALLAAREVAPDDPTVLNQLAFVARQTGDTAGELDAYQAIADADPTNAEAWLALGDRCAAMGDTARSEAAYQRVSELDPENAYQIFFNLGALMINKENHTEADVQKAIAAFRRAVELKPDYAQAQKELGFALLNTDDRTGAAEALAAYVKLAPKAPDAPQMQAIIASLQQ